MDVERIDKQQLKLHLLLVKIYFVLDQFHVKIARFPLLFIT